MPPVIRRSRILFLLLPALSACSSGGGGTKEDPATPATDPAGAVVAIEGDVTARRATATTSRALAMESSVFADDEVTTAAAAQVQIRLRHNDALWTLAAGRTTRVDASAAWSAPRSSGGDLLLVRDDREDRTRAAARAGSQEGISTGEAALDVSEVASAESGGAEGAIATAPMNVPPPNKLSPKREEDAPKPAEERSIKTKEAMQDLFGAESDKDSPSEVIGQQASSSKGTGASEGIGGLGIRGTGQGGAGTGDTVGGLGTIGTKGLGSGTGSGYGKGAGSLGAKANAPGNVFLKGVETTPDTQRDLVKKIANRNWNQIRYCIEQGWQTKPSASGTFVIEFIIGKEGTVPVSIMKTASSTFDPKVSACLSAAPKRWAFPKPGNGGITKVGLTITADATPAADSTDSPAPSPAATASP